MRPSDGTIGLVRGNCRKAVFAFKRLFSEGYMSRFRFGAAGFLSQFSKVRGKSKLAEHNSIFADKTAGRMCSKSGPARQISVFTALPKMPAKSMRQTLEPLSTTGFCLKEPQVEVLRHYCVLGMLFLSILFLSNLAAIVVLPQR